MTPSSITTLFFLFEVTISQSETECDESFECSNQTVYAQNILASGYKSASGPNTIIRATDSYCRCDGAFSCYDVLNMSLPWTIDCRGVHSCANHKTPPRPMANDMWCTAANSCTNSNIDSKGLLACYGFRSCGNSHIAYVPTIWANAAYALENATIDSEGIPGDTLNVYVYGYNAAIYAQIVCRSSHHCHIHCGKCDLLQCSGHCTFYRWDNYNFSEVLTANIDALYNNLKNITLENDEECSNEDISATFDGIDTPFANILISGKPNICCRGSESCSGKTFRNTTATQKFIFSASRSFYNSHLNVSGAIFCSGTESCGDSIVNTSAENVYCFAERSCIRLIINQLHGNVICFALLSCTESTIFTSGNGETHYVYFLGEYSGKSATLHCKQEDECIVICGDRWACQLTTVMCHGVCDIQCNPYTECPVVHTFNPSSYPSLNPTDSPSEAPSGSTLQPSFYPSFNPTTVTLYPTWNETETTAYSSLIPLNQTPTIDTAPISALNSTLNSKINTFATPQPTAMPSMLTTERTLNPVTDPIFTPSSAEVQQDTKMSTESASTKPTYQVRNKSPLWIKPVIITVSIILLCGIFAAVILFIYKRKQDAANSSVLNMEKVAELPPAEKVFEKKRDKIYAESLYEENKENEKICDVVVAEPGEAGEGEADEEGNDTRALFAEWLRKTVKLAQYYDLFVQNGFESLEIMMEVTDAEQLKEVGIIKKGHVLKLMKEIRRLKEKGDNPTVVTTTSGITTK